MAKEQPHRRRRGKSIAGFNLNPKCGIPFQLHIILRRRSDPFSHPLLYLRVAVVDAMHEMTVYLSQCSRMSTQNRNEWKGSFTGWACGNASAPPRERGSTDPRKVWKISRISCRISSRLRWHYIWEEANNNKLSLHYVLLETHVALHWNSPGRWRSTRSRRRRTLLLFYSRS